MELTTKTFSCSPTTIVELGDSLDSLYWVKMNGHTEFHCCNLWFENIKLWCCYLDHKTQKYAIGYWEHCIGLGCGFTEIRNYFSFRRNSRKRPVLTVIFRSIYLQIASFTISGRIRVFVIGIWENMVYIFQIITNQCTSQLTIEHSSKYKLWHSHVIICPDF